MRNHLVAYCLFYFFCVQPALYGNGPLDDSFKGFSFSISHKDAQRLAEKIWRNECGGTIEGLVHWNKGENFASLGIGHFIWYTPDRREHFQETFPALLQFLQKEGVVLPDWLKNASGCPWRTREEFYENIESAQMKSLRHLLYETRELQATFMANCLEDSLPLLIKGLSEQEEQHLRRNFYRLAQDAQGLYALMDYLNFKGLGIYPLETYQSQGWGLRQVLLRIPDTSTQIVADFVQAAKDILNERVQHSPPERNEQRWLKGWFNRLDTYLK